ncbi:MULTISPECIES: hypothetical protein [unclassified Psychrobacillus]|uniref:hypothetical protein n=1 Tax=unclassified Psychrobacillus TaxID=2636677 RepID=UPI0030F7C6E9
MDNQKELFRLMQENPQMEVIPMVYEDVIGEDYSSYQGKLGKVSLEQYYSTDERIYIRSKDEEELEEYMSELLEQDYEEFGKAPGVKEVNFELMLSNRMEKIEWKEVILLYIEQI